MTKIFTVALLMMFSLGASADVKVFFGEKGEELKTGESKIQGDNGIIAIEQKNSDDGSSTTIYLTFSPDNGYTISSDNIEVYAVVSTGSGSTRTPEISGDPLKLTEESSKDSEKRYSVKIDSNLGLWIKKAEFLIKEDGSKRSLQDVEFFYLQNKKNTGHYLYPSGDKDSSGNPYAKTDTKQDLSAVWMLIKKVDEYYIRHYSDGKYLITDDHTVKEKTVKLVEIAESDLVSYGDKALFVINETSEGSDFYNIMPKGANNTSDSKNFLSPINDVGKNIGLNTADVNLSQWKMIAVPAMPTFSQADTKVTISKAFGDVWYKLDNKDITTDDSTNPAVNDGTKGTTVNFKYGPKYTIRAIAAYNNETYEPKGWWTSEVASKDYQVKVAAPSLSVVGNTVTIKGSQSGIKFKYSYVDGANLKTDGTEYNTPFELAEGSRYTVRAIAYNVVEGKTYYSDQESSIVVNLRGLEPISSLEDIDDATGSYVFDTNFTATGSPKNGIGTSETPFRGTLDGGLKTVSRSEPLFECIQDATIKNVILSGVSVSTTGNAGAIACEAKGDSRIYNCGVLDGTVSGSTNVGGLVGLLNGTSRVINCFSYATITGGNIVGGIVGNNNETTTAASIKTMVMNCMFYGDITSGTNISPIYGGKIINNAKGNSTNGLNNYNYYRYESNYSKSNQITSYNCALAAEDKYLVHFEFYRLLLNSNRKLAAYYVTGSADNSNQMAKWVLDNCDKDPLRANETKKPYPILKSQNKYPSIINYDDAHATDLTSSLVNGKPKEEDRNKGGKLGSLSVTISDNTSGKGSRTGSFITTGSKTLPITDKDFDKYNYNYYKVRLPYYNEVGTGNYTKNEGEANNKVVTGWIIEMDGATQASTGEDITTTNGVRTIPYNFAERTCTKDENGDYRVFSQGAYFDVPIGVSAITIKPYWANAAFISDKNLDKSYKNDFTDGTNVAGEQYSDNTTYKINGISMKVRNSFSNALSDITTKGDRVYDNAIVLVGNFHQDAVPYANKTVPFTVMSADFDNDNEPDFSLIYHHIDRKEVSPIRFDFINIPSTSMAQKPNGSSKMCGIGIFKPYGWFEVTNTTLISFGQIEYDFDQKSSAPLVLLGGEVLQIVSNNSNNDGVDCTTHTKYIHVGSNVWFKEFNNGTHSDKHHGTPHRPISVSGGKYEKFYLSGIYQPTINYLKTDDAECYINGGSFGEVAGAGQEKIDGDVNWIIDYADIDNFYGGGINATNAITGNINVTIKNSHVDVYCGGPKFGNMGGYNTANDQTDDKIVTTNAEGCVFRRFFGAGYGGASYNRVIEKTAENNQPWSSWETSYTNNIGKYLSAKKGIATGFEYEYFIGSKGTIWGRFYVNYASFSKAITNNVYSNLTGCHITGDFYGGGSLGVVNGTAFSKLDGCTVDGSVFGGGYSGSIPTIDVVSSGFKTNSYPGYNSNAGLFTPAEISDSGPYKWTKGTLTNNSSALGTVDEIDVIYTDQDLTNLGQVKNVDLTIKGSTYVKGDIHTYDEDGEIETAKTVVGTGGVFGGGDASAVNGSTIVKIEATDTKGIMNVFGGGNKADVNMNTQVKMTGGLVSGNVYGGGNIGYVGTITKNADYNFTWTKTDGTNGNTAENNKITGENTNTGICTVTISGGTIGVDSPDNPSNHGNVFGAGKGLEDTWWCEKAMVFATNVTVKNSGTVVKGNVYGGGQIGRVEDDSKVEIGTLNGEDEPDIKGNVFGAGAGIKTHGYSALVRGNSDVAVQGKAKVGGGVYGGGEIASVGRFTVVGGLPKHPDSGGTCTVTIQDKAKIGTSGTTHNVYGACKGVNPADVSERKSMQLYENRPKNGVEDTDWSYYTTYPQDYDGQKFIWVYYSEADYPAFLKTLALTSHPHVTVAEEATVYGSVFGGGQRGITLGRVDVDITGGTVEQDVYGGGALADTNCGNWDADSYTEVTGLVEGASVAGLYTRTGSGTTESPYVYTATTGENPTYDGSTTYYSKGKWHNLDQKTALYTTTVDLTGGLIKGDAYGGGLGQKTGFNSATSDIAAVVWGDISVNLGSSGGSSATAFEVNKYTDEGHVGIVKSGRVFGCNNLMGSPQGDVRVTVYKTVPGSISRTTDSDKDGVPDKSTPENPVTPTYEVAAVYGGGNLADYTATGKKAYVRIETCDVSIRDVYGGGNAAEVPETDVLVRGAYEIQEVFGGGNGKDPYTNGTTWTDNPGANIGNATHPGNATTLLTGGYIHEAYGGSNQKGTILGSVAIDMGVGSTDDNTNGACTLDVEKLVGAGKNADVNGDLIMIMGCKPSSKTPLLYAGADNANVKGNVELTITSGNYGKVFGGNNEGGAIFGHIKLNIEETGGCDTPITIDELYLGGNMAAYSVYGYYDDGTTMPGSTKPLYKPRTKADDEHQIVTFESLNPHTVPDVTTHQYDNPELNVISCTYIGKVFGGGYGTGAALYGDPIVNINMIQGSKADGVPTFMTTDDRLTALTLDANDNPNKLGVIGDVYGGGNAADIIGNTTVNIGMATTVRCHESVDANGNYTMYPSLSDPGTPVLGAYITGNVFGGGNLADVSGNTYVNICGTQEQDPNPVQGSNGYIDSAVDHSGIEGFAVSIGKSVYGGGNAADVLGNTFVTFADGYVFNGIFGGGLSGSVGTFTSRDKTVTVWNHDPSHEGTCIGKPTACKSGTGTCYVVVSGGQVGPVTVATQGMNRTTNGHGDPVPQGWVWGAGCGLVEDPTDEPDTHFKTYVNNTDVTIKGNAFILESIIGGGEFGRVLGNTLVKIEGGQIGVGAGQVDGNNKPVVYTAAQWTEAEAAVSAGDASRINTIAAAMPACSTFPYTSPYNTYDPYADLVTGTKPYPGGSTDNATDGKTWIGCVFAGGSGYMPYTTEDTDGNITDYDWVQSAGWVEGDAEVRISGGHILTNVYGGNEYTDVKGTCRVTMTGGTVGVPRTVDQILANPMIGHVFGAGKGDPRVHFNKVTNVKDVEVEITGGIVYGSVFGGGEDGHVLHNVTMTIGKTDKTGPTIGTWGTTYIDGYVFGGGRGYSGDAYTAGNVAGCVGVEIKGGNILGSVYGGGQLGSVGYGLFDALTNGSPTPGYGEMRADTDTEEGFSTEGFFSPNGRGHIELTISGGTIGNNYEYIMPQTGSGGNTPTTITETDFTKWSDTDWTIWKDYNYIPKTEFDTTTGRVSHTKGGNVFAGGMGRIYQLDDTTPISAVDWWKMGCVKSTKLTITGGTIKSTVFGGGELGQVVGYHTAKNAKDENVNVGTEVIINGGTIGTEIKESGDVTRFVYGSVFGGGYGSLVEKMTHTGNKPDSYPKYIAGRVKAGTKVKITDGTVVRASVYGGGKMAAVGESTVLAAQTDPVIPGETLTVGHTGDTHVIISGGTIGEAPLTLSDNSIRYFGGAKVGNVYGGGSGHNNTVRSGHVYGNTNVTISDGTIYHNVYGGGAYGSVGEFEYQTTDVSGAPKVSGIKGLSTDHDNTGVATVTITGGTIGVNGKENGMVFGSSRGDINKPEERDDHTAWVYDANVTIGDANGGPAIKGSVYGSGENGHTFNNAVVTVNKGTIGIAEGEDITYTENGQSVTKGGAAYPYRGNVYGGGCGTDKYYSNHEEETHDGNGQLFNPLAGIVYGNATVNINGGTVVRNIYGAGAMGSVGKLNTDGTVTGGTTTINISGGTIGVDGTKGDGNVFGAARGDADAVSNEAALVRKTSIVSITGGTIKGNVYGGGELGCVGTYIFTDDMKNFYWTNEALDANKTTYSYNETGVCNVTISGGTIGTGVAMSNDGTYANGNVFGAGKGLEDTWWCEKAIAYETNVTITDGTINGTVYGGGQVGRVENNAKVTIGTSEETGEESNPSIIGNVFGAGAGVKTHGYSALVRGNATVIVQGIAQVGGSVYGGGEIASVGRFTVVGGLPKHPDSGGNCTVTIKDHAKIGANGTRGHNVFGACKGVTPVYNNTPDDPNRSKSMQLATNAPEDNSLWSYCDTNDHTYIWRYYATEADYLDFLETLALTSHPIVTIAGNTEINGSVFGGGERGITLGSVEVNMNGGTVEQDIYGGGSLANSNKGNWDNDTWAEGKTSATYTTTVNLNGGLIKGDAYGGGLGQKTGFYDTNGAIATSDIEATVYGDITVNLGSIETPATEENAAVLGPATAFNISYEDTNEKDEAGHFLKVVKSGRVFGCNNLNGSPQGNVTVNVFKTVEGNVARTTTGYKIKEGDEGYVAPTYELAAVYGGGNLADYTATGKKTNVIIHTCDVSVQHVYGGGNAAVVPETDVYVKGAYEIEHVFGGGNGKDMYKRANEWIINAGADVSTNTNTLLIGGYIHEAYGGSNERGTIGGNVTINTNSEHPEACDCKLELVKLYGAGKNADIDGDLIVVLDCAPETKTEEIYGGAENANVRGNVELTITSGSFGKVFGGNNQSGAIFGHIILNIEETNCRPIIIDELYGCGNNAAYSIYGYKEGTDEDGYKIYLPRTSLDDGVAVTFNKDENQTAHTTPQYADPQVNIISCTSIGKVFGGGYGSGATVYGNPTVNINQIYGKAYVDNDPTKAYTETATTLGAIGEVFGGGNEANVVGNTNVNIGTASTVKLHQNYDKATGQYSMSGDQTVVGANITGNVYGGGNKAEVTGNTNVVIGRQATE